VFLCARGSRAETDIDLDLDIDKDIDIDIETDIDLDPGGGVVVESSWCSLRGSAPAGVCPAGSFLKPTTIILYK